MARKTRYRMYWNVPAVETKSGKNESGRKTVPALSIEKARVKVRKWVRDNVGGYARFTKEEDTGW